MTEEQYKRAQAIHAHLAAVQDTIEQIGRAANEQRLATSVTIAGVHNPVDLDDFDEATRAGLVQQLYSLAVAERERLMQEFRQL